MLSPTFHVTKRFEVEDRFCYSVNFVWRQSEEGPENERTSSLVFPQGNSVRPARRHSPQVGTARKSAQPASRHSPQVGTARKLVQPVRRRGTDWYRSHGVGRHAPSATHLVRWIALSTSLALGTARSVGWHRAFGKAPKPLTRTLLSRLRHLRRHGAVVSLCGG